MLPFIIQYPAFIIRYAVLVLSVLISAAPAGPLLSPQTIIYKTKADYSKYIPITLSEDRTKVLNYPDPKDVYFNGQLAYPTALAKGYWLDNRGIGPNSVFIKLTYQEYAKLPAAPAPDELFKMILDKDPFIRIYSLGSRYQFKNEVAEINHIIESGGLKHCKRLK